MFDGGSWVSSLLVNEPDAGIITVVIMSMPKHLISFSKPQYSFLEKTSKRMGVSFAELVRRAIDDYRLRSYVPVEPDGVDSKEEIQQAFEEAFGIWKGQPEGAEYKRKQREQWNKRSRSWVG